jgi:hypothetical protein
MEQTHCPTSENLQLGRLVADALGEIERLDCAGDHGIGIERSGNTSSIFPAGRN